MRLNPVHEDQMVLGTPRSEFEETVGTSTARRWAFSLTGLFFILLQSACSLVIAVSGIRVLIGLGALAAVTAGAQVPPTGLHSDEIRIPMMILAIGGSLINLYVIWRIRSLRKRQSSQWRQQPISRKRIWGENAQIALAILTLILVAAEFFAHLYVFRLVG
jgi:hypothetical protein